MVPATSSTSKRSAERRRPPRCRVSAAHEPLGRSRSAELRCHAGHDHRRRCRTARSRSNTRRSVVTLSAKPCSVTHCFTWTPMLAILRPAGPDAGVARDSGRPGCPAAPSAADQRLLELAQVPVQVGAVLPQVEDGIADQLPRAVEVTSPPRSTSTHLDAALAQSSARAAAGSSAWVPRPSVTTGSCSTRSSRSSLSSPSIARAHQAALQLEHLGVRPPAEVDRPGRRGVTRPAARAGAGRSSDGHDRRRRAPGRAARPARAGGRPAAVTSASATRCRGPRSIESTPRRQGWP